MFLNSCWKILKNNKITDIILLLSITFILYYKWVYKEKLNYRSKAVEWTIKPKRKSTIKDNSIDNKNNLLSRYFSTFILHTLLITLIILYNNKRY